MDDGVLVTADSIRRDYVDEFDFLDSFQCGSGVTAAHYTRPSLASLLSAQYEAALSTTVCPPTLPTQLADAGYTCLGYCPNPNTDTRFGFDTGFDTYETFVEPGNQGSKLREYLSKFDLLRQIYYKFYPPQAKSENRPTDREVIDTAIEDFNAAESPRFLWIHMMRSHRPYGREEAGGISQRLDQKAYFKPEKLTDEEEQEIQDAYRGAIRRVDENVEYLLSSIDAEDPKFVFTADHGEAFGELGFYYHQTHKRCVADIQTRVPVVWDNVDVETPLSLVDIAPTILDNFDIDPPGAWDGTSRRSSPADSVLTIAPWGGKTTLAWNDFEKRIVARDTTVEIDSDGTIVTGEQMEVDPELEQQLRDLGYRNAG